MDRRGFLFLFVILFLAFKTMAGEPKIKVLLTAAILTGPEHKASFQERKMSYIKNIQLLKSYGCKVYVVESCQPGPTFLDSYCDHVCYTHSNNPEYCKSWNEVQSMRIGFSHFNFKPDDMIIKITGRYVLQTDDFIKLVKKNLSADGICRLWGPGDAYSGLFALKTSVFLDMIDNHYIPHASTLDRGNYALEHGLGNYISYENDQLKMVFWPRIPSYLPRCGSADG